MTDFTPDQIREALGTASDTIDRMGWELDVLRGAARPMRADPFTTWQGECGHLWRYRGEPNDCPVCNEMSGLRTFAEQEHQRAAHRSAAPKEMARLLEALREEQSYAYTLSEALIGLGHHVAAKHQSPAQYDSDSGLACAAPSCLAALRSTPAAQTLDRVKLARAVGAAADLMAVIEDGAIDGYYGDWADLIADAYEAAGYPGWCGEPRPHSPHQRSDEEACPGVPETPTKDASHD